MNISLTIELETFIQNKVASGMYNSASEVVREGLRLLQEQDKIAQLSAEIRQGLDSGEANPLDVEEIIRECNKKPRPLGIDRGKFTVPDDFDAPLSDEIINSFEGQDVELINPL